MPLLLHFQRYILADDQCCIYRYDKSWFRKKWWRKLCNQAMGTKGLLLLVHIYNLWIYKERDDKLCPTAHKSNRQRGGGRNKKLSHRAAWLNALPSSRSMNRVRTTRIYIYQERLLVRAYIADDDYTEQHWMMYYRFPTRSFVPSSVPRHHFSSASKNLLACICRRIGAISSFRLLHSDGTWEEEKINVLSSSLLAAVTHSPSEHGGWNTTTKDSTVLVSWLKF